MDKYEAIFIIKPDDEEKIKDVIERINNIILSMCYEIIYKEEKGIKKLAYEIKGYKTGYYYYVNFKSNSMDKNSLGEISVRINTMEEVIKYIFLKIQD